MKVYVTYLEKWLTVSYRNIYTKFTIPKKIA